ncbi:MAG: hypothetical protein QXN95_01225 [Candidatus Bathyarchaeia archaeon]
MSNVLVVMLSLILITVIVANVVLWNYQMNQLDIERMHESINITNASRLTRSQWFTAQNEFSTITGSRINGSYADTKSVDGFYETFTEGFPSVPYNPSNYALGGFTRFVSGSIENLTKDDGVHMTFRSYVSATSPQTLYAHRETITIAGATYYLLKNGSADETGINLIYTSASGGETNTRRLFGRFLFPLSGITSIPASTWIIYYRQRYEIGPGGSLTSAHYDVNVLIRKADGTVRTTIATDVASSGSLTTSWATANGTYSFPEYTVVDETDYLEIDFYVHQTSKKVTFYLRIDDQTLAIADQTRAINIFLPSEFACEVEFTGTSNTEDWTQLAWTVNSCFTDGSVEVTLQLFDYQLGQYSTSGDGYISYASSETPNMDETKTQTVITNPTRFRDANGNWRMKITGTKMTAAPFNLKVDWIELKITLSNVYRLETSNLFTIDLSTYSLDHVYGVEIIVRYNVSEAAEDWFIKAYDWASGSFIDIGFNTTEGNQPAANEWNDYAISINENWTRYIRGDGAVQIMFCDEGASENQTLVHIDFIGVRVVLNGIRLEMKNSGATTAHIVSLWIINATHHMRYDVDFFINSGENAIYIRVDIAPPAGNFTVKIVTERGNIDTF